MFVNRIQINFHDIFWKNFLLDQLYKNGKIKLTFYLVYMTLHSEKSETEDIKANFLVFFIS
jgi:hypothetical protein